MSGRLPDLPHSRSLLNLSLQNVPYREVVLPINHIDMRSEPCDGRIVVVHEALTLGENEFPQFNVVGIHCRQCQTDLLPAYNEGVKRDEIRLPKGSTLQDTETTERQDALYFGT